jgi:type II secretion system (T2SS) protein N
MSLRLALSLAILVFLGTLLARFPAKAAAGLLPSSVVCEQPQGTLWRGSCTHLQTRSLTLGDVSWTLHPGALLRATLSADVSSADPRLSGQGRVELARGGIVTARALQVRLPLRGGLSQIPPGFDGTIEAEVASVRLNYGMLDALVGTVRALQLHSDLLGELGSFELRFPEDGSMLGQLRDLSGPIALQGQVQLTRQNGYAASGTLQARPGASQQLAQALQLIGPPDSEGRQSFSLAGPL